MNSHTPCVERFFYSVQSTDTVIQFVDMASETDAENLLTSMFQDPVGYFPPEPSATYVEHTLLCGQTIQLRLVGHNPLWVPTYCKPLRAFRT